MKLFFHLAQTSQPENLSTHEVWKDGQEIKIALHVSMHLVNRFNARPRSVKMQIGKKLHRIVFGSYFFPDNISSIRCTFNIKTYINHKFYTKK